MTSLAAIIAAVASSIGVVLGLSGALARRRARLMALADDVAELKLLIGSGRETSIRRDDTQRRLRSRLGRLRFAKTRELARRTLISENYSADTALANEALAEIDARLDGGGSAAPPSSRRSSAAASSGKTVPAKCR
jgi:hypothetical protein